MFSKKELRRLIIPLIFEQFLAVTVGMADSLMVSRVGEAAVSGVSLVDSINVLLIGLFAALATGGAVVVAQFIGQKNEINARKSAEQLIIITMIISVVTMLITIILNGFILRILFGKVEIDVMNYAKTYLFYSALSFPFIALYNACAAVFRSMGDSRTPLYTSILMNGLNIIGNGILIFGFGLGVAGAAISTLIARIVAGAFLNLLLRDRKRMIYIESWRTFELNPVIIQKILRIGIPNGLENSVFHVGKIIVQGIVAGLGTAAITANVVSASIGGFGTIPGVAISLALITVVGTSMGSHDFDGVKEYTNKLLKIAHLSMFFVNLIIFLTLPITLKMYNLSPETGKIAYQIITYHCILSVLFWPQGFALPNALRAANDVKFTMIVSLFSMWLFRIGFSYILAINLNMGVMGVWVAMTIDWLFRGTCFIIRFKQEKYRKVIIE